MDIKLLNSINIRTTKLQGRKASAERMYLESGSLHWKQSVHFYQSRMHRFMKLTSHLFFGEMLPLKINNPLPVVIIDTPRTEQKIIRVKWFTDYSHTVGIIIAEDSKGEPRAYLGVCINGDEQKDIDFILAYGAKFPLSAALLLE